MNKLSWIGTAASIAGAFLVAFSVILFGYIAFTIGSISWLIVGHFRKDKSLVVLNGTFFLANIIGLYRVIYT